MKRWTLLMIVIFVLISYIFLVKFSKDVHIELVNYLDDYDYVECPAGISLFRLKTPMNLYTVQIQSKLPHNPTEKSTIVKQCEKQSVDIPVEENVRIETGNKSIQNTNAEFFKFQPVEGETLRLLDKSCDKLTKDQTSSESVSFKRRQWLVNKVTANAWLSYMLQVIKGPAPLDLSGYKTESDAWSYYTLSRGIFPGTLWCGFGNLADDIYGQVGDHSETDDCCRSHDLCKPIIKAFETRYFYSNPSVLPISHCGCDNEFYSCLLRARNPTAQMIGKIFFNLVQMKCFDFDVREVCVSSFLGLCIEIKERCVAVLKSNKQFPI